MQIYNHLAQSSLDSWSIKYKYKNIPEPKGSEFWIASSLAAVENLTSSLSDAVKRHQPVAALRARGLNEQGMRFWIHRTGLCVFTAALIPEVLAGITHISQGTAGPGSCLQRN